MSGERGPALVVRRPGEAVLEERGIPGPGEALIRPRAAGIGYDLVIEAAGSTDAVLSALAAARRGGTVVLLGLPPHGATAAVPVDDVVNNDLIIRGSFGYTSAAWREVVTLLNAGLLELGFLVTHRFPLTEWRAALDTLRGEASPRGKVMLTIGST
jgi:threonine dehydrogenase-like Zn-dependent dehydrogenase